MNVSDAATVVGLQNMPSSFRQTEKFSLHVPAVGKQKQ